MDNFDMEESDAFFNSCRTRALHDFNDVLEQSLELSKDVLDALVENQLISNHVKDMLSGPSLDNEAKVQGVLFNIKKSVTEDKFNRFLSVIENTGLRHVAKAIWRSYSERANVYEPKLKHVGCQTEIHIQTKLPIRERQKLCRIYDKLQKGLKRKPRRIYFDEPRPDENSIRIEDVDREIDKLLELFHEQIRYIGKFCDKLGLEGKELPTIGQEIEKLVEKCKGLENKVNSMSVDKLFNEYLNNEGSSTSESSFSSAIQRPRISGNFRTSSPFMTSDLHRQHGSHEHARLKRKDSTKPGKNQLEVKQEDENNDYFLSVHPKLSPLTPRKNGIRANTTKTSVIMQSHFDLYERLLLQPTAKDNAPTSSRVIYTSNNFVAKSVEPNRIQNVAHTHEVFDNAKSRVPSNSKNLATKKELNRITISKGLHAHEENGKVEFSKTSNSKARKQMTRMNFRRSSQQY